MTTVLVGVGNRDRGDDAVGPLIAEAVAAAAGGVVALAHEGDLSLLPLCWGPDDDVTIVDAVLVEPLGCVEGLPAVGRLAEIDRDRLRPSHPTSTHGLGVAAALDLADRLGRTPATLRILVVGARSTAFGQMSPELVARLPQLVESVVEEIGRPRDGSGLPREGLRR